jgi:hypothetical protein
MANSRGDFLDAVWLAVKLSSLIMVFGDASGTANAKACVKGGFFGLPAWWEFLNLDSNCTPIVSFPSGIWAIGLAILDILLRVAGIAAVISLMVSAVMYLTSAGDPGRAGAALSRIINSMVGLAIVVVASAIVAFIGGRI